MSGRNYRQTKHNMKLRCLTGPGLGNTFWLILDRQMDMKTISAKPGTGFGQYFISARWTISWLMNHWVLMLNWFLRVILETDTLKLLQVLKLPGCPCLPWACFCALCACDWFMREFDPCGVEQRKHGHLHRRMYVSPGANLCWLINGCDKLKPFGFSICGCVNGLSQRIIWLEVQHSNKNPRLIARYFLRGVKGAHGCPVRLYTERGTENGILAAMQCYLRTEGLDEYAASKAHKYVKSTRNQQIESYWSHSQVGQVGGLISSMISWNLTFSTSPMRSTPKPFGFALRIFCRMILIK